MKAIFLATFVVASAWSAGAAAAQGPSLLPREPKSASTPGAAEEAPSTAALSAPPPLRVGVIGGMGFPRPLAIEALAEVSGYAALGVEAGVQIPLSPDVSSSLPIALYPSAQRTIEALGSSVIPTVDLVRVGLVL